MPRHPKELCYVVKEADELLLGITLTATCAKLIVVPLSCNPSIQQLCHSMYLPLSLSYTHTRTHNHTHTHTHSTGEQGNTVCRSNLC